MTKPQGSPGKELAPVGVRPSVGHGEQAAAGVLDGEVLVREAVAVNAAATPAVAPSEVPALDRGLGPVQSGFGMHQ